MNLTSRTVARWRVGVPGALVGLAFLAGCGDDGEEPELSLDDVDEEVEEVDPLVAPDPDPALQGLELSLTEVAAFDEPMVLAARPGDDDLYVAERDGRVYHVGVHEDDSGEQRYDQAEEPLVDLRDESVTEEEQGLVGMAFSPDGERLYLGYSLAPEGDTQVVSYVLTRDDEPEADEASRRDVLHHPQPYNTHNNGTLAFGPDGYLYVGMGDGGHIGDPHGYGQDLTTMLGSLLRIDPESAVGADQDVPYFIPEDNPFIDDHPELPGEVWLYGVRNPWRFSFDMPTGDLWIGDVGQAEWEEINHLPGDDPDHPGGWGANLGWNGMEGSHPFEGGSNPSGAVLPAYDFPNHREGGDGGCAVMGGLVYRGSAVPELAGTYLFGDWCNPSLRALTLEDGEVVHHTLLEDAQVEELTQFGVDNADEVYVVSQAGPIYRLGP